MSSILEAVKHCEIRTFTPGEVVLAQGTLTGLLFFLIEGRVDVVIDDVLVCTESQPGAVFGDLSVLLDTDHTATVRATEPSAFYVVKNPRAFIDELPEVCRFLCELLASRLHAINRYLVAVKHRADRPGSTEMIRFLESLMRRQRPDAGQPKDTPCSRPKPPG